MIRSLVISSSLSVHLMLPVAGTRAPGRRSPPAARSRSSRTPRTSPSSAACRIVWKTCQRAPTSTPCVGSWTRSTGVGLEPLREHDLLLVAAAQGLEVHHRLGRARRRTGQSAPACTLEIAPAIEPIGSVPVDHLQHHVVAHRAGEPTPPAPCRSAGMRAMPALIAAGRRSCAPGRSSRAAHGQAALLAGLRRRTTGTGSPRNRCPPGR